MGVGAGRINEEMNENDNLLLSYKNRHKLRKDLEQWFSNSVLVHF